MELPDEVAALLTTPEGMEWARRAVLEAYEEMRPAQGEELQEMIEAVNEGLAAIEAGEKGYTPEEVDARMKAKFPFLKDRSSGSNLSEKAA